MVMYQEFFGLQEDPFRVNPDPRYLFLTPGTQEALTSLAYGIQNRYGIILMTGQVGTGKTTLLQAILDGLHQSQAVTAFIFNTRLSVRGLFNHLMTDFGILCESKTKTGKLSRLNQWLLDRFRAGQTAVLIVDEAQNLSVEVLEEIRLLSNLETSTEKLLQIVLSGQPELEAKLKRTELRQLRQRIAIRCRTAELSPEETEGYILKRVAIAGAEGRPIFSPEAIESVYLHSQGIPRVINILCGHALIHAFADQMSLVSAAHIAEVAKDFDLDGTESDFSPTGREHPQGPADWDETPRSFADTGLSSPPSPAVARHGENES
jgi:general secretion pathway protein A